MAVSHKSLHAYVGYRKATFERRHSPVASLYGNGALHVIVMFYYHGKKQTVICIFIVYLYNVSFFENLFNNQLVSNTMFLWNTIYFGRIKIICSVIIRGFIQRYTKSIRDIEKAYIVRVDSTIYILKETTKGLKYSTLSTRYTTYQPVYIF